MGVENNEAILATTWSDEAARKCGAWIGLNTGKFAELFEEIPSLTNSKTTVVFAPSGSKKGWSMDECAELIRDQFIEFLESFNYEDGSSPWSWVEVGWGEYGQKVLRGNCKNCYSDEEYAND